MQTKRICGRTVQVLWWPWRVRVGRWRYMDKERGPAKHIFNGYLFGPIELRVWTRRWSRKGPLT